MELTHRFTVPTGVEETWAHFGNIAEVAECFPGATVNDVEGDTFHGSCKVKLGPIALVYNGSGTFVEKDDAAHRFVVDAKGKDKRGNGTAGAKVTLSMDGNGETTDVEVLTDLAITGKPAQFGRGVMQDVSDKLLGQFVACLETRLAGGTDELPGEPGQPAAAAPPGAGEGAVAPAAEPEQPATPAEPAAPVTPVAPPVPAAEARPAAGSHAARSAPPQDDAINLGSTVLPILAKTYWKQAAAVAAVVAIVIWWVTKD
jgi:carbon monoxide dehydrogenase subunit G